jgi:plasmid replication initiation protein
MAKKIENEKDLVVYRDNDLYSKSNVIISAKYKSTLFENKVTATCLSKISNRQYTKTGEGPDSSIVVSMTASEIKNLLGASSGGSFYRELDRTARSMTSRSIGMSDLDENRFVYLALIQKAEYKDGVFTVRFNSELSNFLTPDSNFSRLNLSMMLDFDSNSSFRLYEILKSRCYHPDGRNAKGDTFEIQYGLSELKLLMGVVNADLDAVRRVLDASPAPNYDKAVEKSPEKTYSAKWSDFKRRVIDVAVKEINEKSDLAVTYETIRSGRGGKTTGIIFYAKVKADEKKSEAQPQKEEDKGLSKDEQFKIFFELYETFEKKIEFSDIEAICDAADYNLDEIKKAYNMLKKSKKEPDNPTGWMISCIKEKWYDASPVVEKEKVSEEYTNKKQFREKRNAQLIRLIQEERVKLPPEAIELVMASDFPIEFILEHYGV